MLTAKNLQCMRAILSVAHCHGNLLGSSWHIILTVNIIKFLTIEVPKLKLSFPRKVIA